MLSQSYQAIVWNFSIYGQKNWGNHDSFFCALRVFTQLELMQAEELIENWYEVQRTLLLKVAREFILEHLKEKVGSTFT